MFSALGTGGLLKVKISSLPFIVLFLGAFIEINWLRLPQCLFTGRSKSIVTDPKECNYDPDFVQSQFCQLGALLFQISVKC